MTGQAVQSKSVNLVTLAKYFKWPQSGFFRSPAGICLLGALAARIWLVVYTKGIIDGDEALVGIQAEQILHGAHPVYYFGQPYAGSLEAYLVALVFSIAGPSAWTLRTEPILLSVLLIWLTWKLANALAELAHLPDYAKLWFVTIATCIAALPPLYDLVIEMRTLGGYIESFVVMLCMLLSALRLTQRWHDASVRELILRWAGIGFLVGLGLWVNPLIIMAILAAAIWITGYIVHELVRNYKQLPVDVAYESLAALLHPLKKMCPAVVALPSALLGFAPAISWGLQNNWENIHYLFSTSTNSSGSRLTTIEHVGALYGDCSVPRIIGGALPTESGATATNPHLLTPVLVLGGCCLLITLVTFGLSLFWQQTLLLQVQRLASLPLLFAACSAVIFCLSSIAARILIYGCGPRDLVGRYATPLVLALPFLFATAPTLIVMYLVERNKQQQTTNNHVESPAVSTRSHTSNVVKVSLLALVLIYACIEGFSYMQTSPNYTMQTSGCTVAPANNAPVIAYMRREHIRYAWATGWVGNPITFVTDSSIIVVDPRQAADPSTSRIPAYTEAVLHADRPSVLLLVSYNDSYPDLLKRFDQERITYRVARFPSEPGVDLLVITPLNRSVSPADGHDLGVNFGGC
ncbi:MAG: hypothetical protein ACLQUY_25665 [Ktedonobacterales bacterium]